MTTQPYKAGYETGYKGRVRAMTKAQYTAGMKDLEDSWREYRKGLKAGREDKREGYEYNHG